LLALFLAQQAPPSTDVEGVADPAQQAEYYRLSEEMARLAERQVWSGVERKFEQLEALSVTLSYQDYWYGALAARNLGDVQASYDRLSAAAKIEGTREVIDWLWSIDTQYGRVELRTEPAGPSTLAIAAMPMVPDQRAAVEAAQRQVAETGAYSGMLPEGDYTFADQAFTVSAGPKAVTIVVQPVDEPGRRRGGE
jgi:hypothetical protein